MNLETTVKYSVQNNTHEKEPTDFSVVYVCANQRTNPPSNHGVSLSALSRSLRPWLLAGYPHVNDSFS
jgi:hypothetical protein